MIIPANDSSPSPPDGADPAHPQGRWRKFWLSERMVLWGMAGFLAGYLVMWNVEMQLMWLAAVCLPAAIAYCARTRGAGMTRAPMLRLAAAFLVWNLAVGLMRNPDALAEYYTFEFLAGSVLLPVFWGGLWLAFQQKGTGALLTVVMARSGLAAAVAGILWWWLVQRADDPCARLRNPLVHGGHHPVGTAITIGFAAVATAFAYGYAPTRRGRLITLGMLAIQGLAVMLTLSRGALLALLCVPVALVLMLCVALLVDLTRGRSFCEALQPVVRGWPKAWPPLLTSAVVFAGFQFLAPLLSPVDFTPHPAGSSTPKTALAVLTDFPFREYIARGDSGRSFNYRFGIACLDSKDKQLIGAGLWGPELKLETATHGQINHFHSVYVATYVHGGLIGSVLLAGLVGLGIAGSWVLFREGNALWVAFLAYGLGGLIFDGHSACSLVTHPRFENLILWFPLIAVAALWRNRQKLQTGRQPSSSESR